MWHKAEWMGRPMRLELTRVGLLDYLANRYTTRGALVIQDIEQVRGMFTFIIRRDWEGSDVSRFSLANTILKTQ